MNMVNLRPVVCTIFLTISMSASAAVETFSSGGSVTLKSVDGVSIVFPDVCNTPSGPIGGSIPIPYPNVAISGETRKGPKYTKVSGKKPVAADSNLKMSTNRQESDFVLYSFDVQPRGQLHIRQFARMTSNKTDSIMPATTANNVPYSTQAAGNAKSSVTEVTYVDASGRETRLQEPTLIELANGEFCAVCVANGKVTAIHRLLTATPKRKQRQAPRQNNR